MGGTTGLRACIKGLVVVTTNGFGPRRPSRVITIMHGSFTSTTATSATSTRLASTTPVVCGRDHKDGTVTVAETETVTVTVAETETVTGAWAGTV